MASYYFHVGTENLVTKPKPGDIFIFDVTVNTARRNYSSRQHILRSSIIFAVSMVVSYESVFENCLDFLRLFLSNPQCFRYFSPETLNQILTRIVSRIQQVLLDFPSGLESADSAWQQFTLPLGIFVELREDDEEIENTATEESMQEVVTTIPASSEAVHSLKTFTHSHLLETEECSICKEEFHAEEGDEDVKLLSSLPCNHVFHHQCIVRWLQINHICPLCRYPMPTTTN